MCKCFSTIDWSWLLRLDVIKRLRQHDQTNFRALEIYEYYDSRHNQGAGRTSKYSYMACYIHRGRERERSHSQCFAGVGTVAKLLAYPHFWKTTARQHLQNGFSSVADVSWADVPPHAVIEYHSKLLRASALIMAPSAWSRARTAGHARRSLCERGSVRRPLRLAGADILATGAPVNLRATLPHDLLELSEFLKTRSNEWSGTDNN